MEEIYDEQLRASAAVEVTRGQKAGAQIIAASGCFPVTQSAAINISSLHFRRGGSHVDHTFYIWEAIFSTILPGFTAPCIYSQIPVGYM